MYHISAQPTKKYFEVTSKDMHNRALIRTERSWKGVSVRAAGGRHAHLNPPANIWCASMLGFGGDRLMRKLHQSSVPVAAEPYGSTSIFQPKCYVVLISLGQLHSLQQSPGNTSNVL